MIPFEGKYTKANVMIDQIESSCSSQIVEFINHPAFTQPVVIMPDCHAGKGSVIGFTMPLREKDIIIIPNTIGVDIGCGLLSVNVGKNIFANITKEKLDQEIRRLIPFGFYTHTRPIINMERQFPWEEAYRNTIQFANVMGWDYTIPPTIYDYKLFKQKCKQVKADIGRAENSIGTLGSGNHFIEVGRSKETGDYWVTVHSGSRNFGLRICQYWQKVADKNLNEKRSIILQEEIKKIKEKSEDRKQIRKQIQKKKDELGLETTVHKGLTYLSGKDAFYYLFDMVFAQKFAKENRAVMMNLILDTLDIAPIETIESIHNYIDFQDFIIRKGAIRSVKGKKMVIPFNMRDGILICEGKSNPDWNFSAPHGAGRAMSRTEAKKKLQVDKFEKQMEGIYSTSVGKGTLDEAPDAYKDASIIEAAIEPTAKILDRIKPVINLKDKGKRKNK